MNATIGPPTRQVGNSSKRQAEDKHSTRVANLLAQCQGAAVAGHGMLGKFGACTLPAGGQGHLLPPAVQVSQGGRGMPDGRLGMGYLEEPAVPEAGGQKRAGLRRRAETEEIEARSCILGPRHAGREDPACRSGC